jgi:hypothetical protein
VLKLFEKSRPFFWILVKKPWIIVVDYTSSASFAICFDTKKQ